MAGSWQQGISCAGLALALLSATAHRSAGAEHQGSNSAQVFEELKGLEGIWRGEGGRERGPSSPAVHEFRVSAGGTVVMEIMDPDGEREINIYRLEGDELVMTHFCGRGNQPTMRLDEHRASPLLLPFVFSRGSNLDPAVDGHMHAAELEIDQAGGLVSRWTAYREGKEVWTSSFRLVRVPEVSGENE